MADETCNGYKNRETWAFNLQWQNDEGLYHMVLDFAESTLLDWDDLAERLKTETLDEAVAYELGECVIDFVKEQADEALRADLYGPGARDFWKTLLDDIGSFWRVDEKEVGSDVLESLDAEGQTPDLT